MAGELQRAQLRPVQIVGGQPHKPYMPAMSGRLEREGRVGARLAGRVLSIENDAAWQQRVSTLAAQRGLTNLRCEHHPIDARRPDLYPSLSYLAALQPDAHDVIVVDGFCDYENSEHGLLRDLTFDRALACVRRPGGLIVVDDYWRFPAMAQRAPEARLTVFQSTGPCRYGVTSTAVFEF